MTEDFSWRGLFFSGNPPGFLKTKINRETEFLHFDPEDKNWKLGGLVDTSRPTANHSIQMFWLRSKGRRRYIGRVVSELEVASSLDTKQAFAST